MVSGSTSTDVGDKYKKFGVVLRTSGIGQMQQAQNMQLMLRQFGMRRSDIQPPHPQQRLDSHVRVGLNGLMAHAAA